MSIGIHSTAAFTVNGVEQSDFSYYGPVPITLTAATAPLTISSRYEKPRHENGQPQQGGMSIVVEIDGREQRRLWPAQNTVVRVPAGGSVTITEREP